jgi:hypothetical protein
MFEDYSFLAARSYLENCSTALGRVAVGRIDIAALLSSAIKVSGLVADQRWVRKAAVCAVSEVVEYFESLGSCGLSRQVKQQKYDSERRSCMNAGCECLVAVRMRENHSKICSGKRTKVEFNSET